MVLSGGQILLTRGIYSVPLASVFAVKVGAVSGADEIFANAELGNADFVCSKTAQTGELRRMIYLDREGPIALAGAVQGTPAGAPGDEVRRVQLVEVGPPPSRFRRAAPLRQPEDAQPRPFFLNDCRNYDGAILALFPHRRDADLARLRDMLNDVDWAELGFVCDGRFLFAQRSLEQALLPEAFRALHGALDWYNIPPWFPASPPRSPARCSTSSALPRPRHRHRALVPHPVAGAHAAVLLLGRPAQRRLQAGAGRHQPLPGRLQQPQPGLPAAVRAGGDVAIEKICPDAKNLLLIPENHTRNQFYLMNVARLATILARTGLNVRIGSLIPEITAPTRSNCPTARSCCSSRSSANGRLGLEDFDPCAILLNNDLSAGVPDDPEGPARAGPHPAAACRLARAAQVAPLRRLRPRGGDFAKAMGIDPWLINPDFAVCGQVNFHERCRARNASPPTSTRCSTRMRPSTEYGIDEPFVIVKADAGTYGMGIMTVKDASEVIGLNRKQRNKMAVGKEGLEVTEVIIQEGVHTFETVEGGSPSRWCT
jgi:hypothetical protein